MCAASDSCNVNVDTLSVSAPGSAAPAEPDPGYLGGYTRGFDTATYGPGYSCPSGTPTASQCTAALPQMHPGLLDRAGYRLLDDTQSAVWTRDGWVAPRPANGDTEDGYLFVYGNNYSEALEDLNKLTGPSPLLDEANFGVWYSDYYPYTTSDYENSLIPAFRANDVPLDDLSVDTDWKSPNTWDGWEPNPALFPDLPSFLAWAKSQGIDVTLNVHTSIADDDPQLAATQALAGGPLTDSTCFIGACKTWDWSQVDQAESYFALHQPYESQGVSFWWLDWCCDASTVSMPGLTPDAWINHLYAMDLANKGQRGFVLSRTGSSYQNPDEVYPAGPWSGHTSTLAFTGDSWGTWNTLAFQAQLSADEASIDEPYVSNDIGSFLGPPPGNPQDDADLYARWVQLGTFQPVLRLHSSAGNRLPWDYPGPSDAVSASFLRLREALVPYTYTLADQAVRTGLPITRPLYLDYPGQAAAYANPGEYLYGPDVLVAPVATPGNVTTQRVWFPPGRWTDYFTGATFDGPATRTLTVPLDRMPVFVKAGGIIPEQAPMDHVGADPGAPLTLRVYAGAAAAFSLYQDAGSGTGYEKGQYSLTSVGTTPAGAGHQQHRRHRPGAGQLSRPARHPPFRRRHRRRQPPAGGPARRAAARRERLDLRSRDPHCENNRFEPGERRQRPRHRGRRHRRHPGRAGRRGPEHRPGHAAEPVPRADRHGDDHRAQLRPRRRRRHDGDAQRAVRMDGNPGRGRAGGHDRARFFGHPVLDGAGAGRRVPVAADRLAAGAGPLHERGTARTGVRRRASPARRGSAAGAGHIVGVARHHDRRLAGHAERAELRLQPGLQLSHPGSGRHELGRALRRRQGHHHRLERHRDRLHPAARQRPVPARTRNGHDHRDRRRPDLGRADHHDHPLMRSRPGFP